MSCFVACFWNLDERLDRIPRAHTPVYTWFSWNMKTIMNDIELANAVFVTRKLRAVAYVSIWRRLWTFRTTTFRRGRTLIGELTDYLYGQRQTVANGLHRLPLLRSLLQPSPSTPIGCADVSPENAQQNVCGGGTGLCVVKTGPCSDKQDRVLRLLGGRHRSSYQIDTVNDRFLTEFANKLTDKNGANNSFE